MRSIVTILLLMLFLSSGLQLLHGTLHSSRLPSFWHPTGTGKLGRSRASFFQLVASRPSLPSSCAVTASQYWNALSHETKRDIRTSLVSLTVSLLTRSLLLESRHIPTWSMYPTFKAGDYVLFDKVSYLFRGYRRRDVVLFRPTVQSSALTNTTALMVKRIAAAAGDEVEVRKGHLYINGVMQREEYIHGLPEYSMRSSVVPEGAVMVLGDNRNNSCDSHVWGFLPVKHIVGRAVLRYWPPWRTGTIEGCSYQSQGCSDEVN